MEIDEPFYLWPENAPVLQLWFAVQTQWQYGPRGQEVGMKYEGVESCMRLQGIPEAERAELFDGLRAMEVAALNEWAEGGR